MSASLISSSLKVFIMQDTAEPVLPTEFARDEANYMFSRVFAPISFLKYPLPHWVPGGRATFIDHSDLIEH